MINYISGQDVRHSDYALVDEANYLMAVSQGNTLSATITVADFELPDTDEGWSGQSGLITQLSLF